jgi:hypothetical protein
MRTTWFRHEKIIHLKMLDEQSNVKDKMIMSLDEAKDAVRVLQLGIEQLEKSS